MSIKLNASVVGLALVLSATAVGAAPGLAPAAAPVAAPPVVVAKPGTVVVTTSPVSVERARAHVFRPANTINVQNDEMRDGPALIAVKQTVAKQNAKLNVAKFGADVQAVFKDYVRGYAMQVRHNGQIVANQSWQFARTPQDGIAAFTADTRMHIASLSKMIAMIATVKALDEKNLSFDTQIGEYLPTYWTVGSNVANLTFRNLLTHTTGFSIPSTNTDCGCAADFATLKAKVAAGVGPAPHSASYENVNFSLLRVILPILTGAVQRGTVYNVGGLSPDVLWDLRTIDAFEDYVRTKVFAPAGVGSVVTVPQPGGALAYRDSSDAAGWDWGDVASILGAAGFRMTVKECLDVMDAFRRKGTIVSAAKAQAALDAGLGIDQTHMTAAGRIWNKNGGWGNDNTNRDAERTVGFFLADGYEVVVFVNSNIPGDGSLRDTIRNAYTNNLE